MAAARWKCVYDAVVLDRDLPEVHGDDVCRALNERAYAARVLMLTAAGELEDLIGGLDLGADDYLVKPVRLPELSARLRALGRALSATLAHGRRPSAWTARSARSPGRQPDRERDPRHGGTLTLEARPAGGLRAVVRLPAGSVARDGDAT